MIAYLLSLLTLPALLTTPLACDPLLTALFTPARPNMGHYQICTTAEPVEVLAAQRADGPHYGPSELVEPLDAFGAAGTYDRAALARLYAGKRVRVARGWVEYPDRFESVTLLSPYPDATLSRLLPGTMVVTWTLSTLSILPR
jgi:hypothetical protein